jgi:gamma-glutamyl hydrolase
MFDDYEDPEDFHDEEWTYNSHKWGVRFETFGPSGDPDLAAFYTPTSISVGKATGVEFVATMEANDYPFMGVQFHPEKIGRIFNYRNIDQSWESIHANNYFSEKFVSLARQNDNYFGNNDKVQQSVIHNYDLVVYNGYYEEVYVFP